MWLQTLVEYTADDIARERLKAKYTDPGVFPILVEEDWRPTGDRRVFTFQVCGVDAPEMEVSLADVLRRLLESP